ncbi:MAG: site-specific DNA-methyltransferase [candidate division NC10 bacterium]|nr:site-specific DNA-methyltransferase [candidate division NC10 bacterium]MDE2320949.1 site-specific DNA-methyltransferase [candidate division NC10 bacterium]
MQKLTAEDMDTKSPDLVAENVEQLNVLFPEAFTEGKVDFEVLKQLLGGAVDEREEKYGLNWHGKRRARQIALTPSTGTLRPCPEDSVDWETTRNLMIEGDNLEVLKLLQKSYAGKVKFIYIDQPYNTGKDFVYPDDYRDNIKNYLELTGQVEGGQKISTNTEASGRFHTNWLNMMYPRLKLARNLLCEDGVIFISIDDNEAHNLRKVCDELFGEDNFIGQFVINSSPSAIDYGHIAKMHDYALLYAKDLAVTTTKQLTEDGKEFKYVDGIGPFNIYPLYNGNVAFNPRTRPNLYYPFYLNPDSKIENDFYEIGLKEESGWVKVYPVISRKDEIQRVWRWSKDKSRQELNKEIVGYKTEDSEFRIVQKTRHTGKVIRSLQIDKEISSRRGTAEVEELFGEKVFPFPKPFELIRRFVAVGTETDSIVVDFFAGSATTAHAVMAQNALDQGKRRYFLVQLPEPLDPENTDQKVAADYCDKLGKPRNIAELTKERLRRAGKKIREENPMFAGDLGFRVFKLDSSNIRAWEPDRENLAQTLEASVEHLKTDRTEADILFELLLKRGIDLCTPIEQKTIAGKTIHSIGAGTLLVCLAPQIARDEVEPLALGMVEWHKVLAPAGESTVIFRDSAFADDVAKTNLTAILQQHGLENVRSL